MSTISLRTSSEDYRPYDSFSSELTVHSHLSAASKSILDCQDCKEQNSTCAFCFIAYAQDPEQRDTKIAHQVFKEVYGFSHSPSAMDIEEDSGIADMPTEPSDYREAHLELDPIFSRSTESSTALLGAVTSQVEYREVEMKTEKCVLCTNLFTQRHKITIQSLCHRCYMVFWRARQKGRPLDPSRDSLYTARPELLTPRETEVFNAVKEFSKKNPNILRSWKPLFTRNSKPLNRKTP